jgi:hypothetical protein
MRGSSLSLLSLGSVGALAIAGAWLSACLGSSSSCPLGTETCGCGPGGTCSTGLTCYAQPAPINGVCLSPINVGGSGGSGGTGAGGSGGTGGAGGSGGSGGTAGAGGSGGSAGGTAGAGGSGGSGGSADAGGSGGTAGAGGSGGSGGSSGNLVTNGNFASGTTDWGTINGTATIGVTGTQLCVSGITTNVQLAWPQGGGTPFALTAGASYTLSYSAMATVPLTIDAKVGYTMPGYTADFETSGSPACSAPSTCDPGGDMVGTSLTPFTHTWTEMTGGDTSTGLAFTLPQTGNVPSGETQVCFANVSVVQN